MGLGCGNPSGVEPSVMGISDVAEEGLVSIDIMEDAARAGGNRSSAIRFRSTWRFEDLRPDPCSSWRKVSSTARASTSGEVEGNTFVPQPCQRRSLAAYSHCRDHIVNGAHRRSTQIGAQSPKPSEHPRKMLERHPTADGSPSCDK